jgi:hypothetical protein
MIFTNQNRDCHAERVSQSPERSEGEASLYPSRETLRCAQGDKALPILVVKLHYRPSMNDPRSGLFC